MLGIASVRFTAFPFLDSPFSLGFLSPPAIYKRFPSSVAGDPARGKGSSHPRSTEHGARMEEALEDSGAAHDELALWRRIDMRGHPDLDRVVNLYGLARVAVCHAKGQCEAFWAEYAANDDVLNLLGEQAPSLKSLRLICCQDSGVEVERKGGASMEEGLEDSVAEEERGREPVRLMVKELEDFGGRGGAGEGTFTLEAGHQIKLKQCLEERRMFRDAHQGQMRHDCGFHMLMHAEHWDGRTVCNFNEKDMPNIRKLLTYKWFMHPENDT